VDRGPTAVRRPPGPTGKASPVVVLICLLASGCALPPPVRSAVQSLQSLAFPRTVQTSAATRQPMRPVSTPAPALAALPPIIPVPVPRPIHLADGRDVAVVRALARRSRAASAAVDWPEGRLVWPLRGKVVNAFGRQPDGRRNDGIDIAAASTTVLAAADGMVVFAGESVPGYGTMVMIGHADGFTTVYARASVLLVAAGDHVARGQPIARLDSGDGGTRRLHFQLRSASDPIDPTPFLLPDEAVMASVLQPLK
jgi:murein DD-endopeptidase MepM/ murein hydrolase activator NlpD